MRFQNARDGRRAASWAFLGAATLLSTIEAAPAPVPLQRPEYFYDTSDPFAILDPQNWVNPVDMTWSEFIPPPNTNWSDPSIRGTSRNFNIALVAVDYPDKDFVITLPANSTVFQNPQPIINNLNRSAVSSFYRDLLNLPQSLNRNHTLHEYWMEDSRGRFGVDLTSFGPYRLPSNSYQYGIDDSSGGFNPNACPDPATNPCSIDLRTDALGAWKNEIGNETAEGFELVFILSAGQDESSTWQEFGEMKFADRDDVPDSFGPPNDINDSLPNWATTRYVPWTSWSSASTIWPNAGSGSSTQAESSGMATYAHELSHLLGIADNYNNPFGTPARRSYTGPWSMLSRGSFNGPGGPHTRWQIPALEGGSLGSLHTVRDKLQIGLVDNSSVLFVKKGELIETGGVVVTEVTARSVDAGAGTLLGLRIVMGDDESPLCNTTTSPLCDGGNYQNYDFEVIDRMGSDSFVPDSGVMISKTKDLDTSAPFQWTVDANPEDIGVVDFLRPNGSEALLSVGDYRQLADALFHAGTRSGSKPEYVDEGNGLHFYILNVRRDDEGVLHYTVGARAITSSNTTNNSAITHSVAINTGIVTADNKNAFSSPTYTCSFELTNTGTFNTSTSTTPTSFPSNETSYFSYDIFRLSAAVLDDDENSWRVELPNALAFAKFGGKTVANVAVGAPVGGGEATVELTATSESDAGVMASRKCYVGSGRSKMGKLCP